MKTILETIRKQWAAGLFRHEQQIRFSLLGRVLQALGWDIFDPAEVQLDRQLRSVLTPGSFPDRRESVDLLLMNSGEPDSQRQICIFVAASEHRFPAIVQSLQTLHFGPKTVFVALTNGIRWSFYLPRTSVSLTESLFYEIDLSRDDPGSCCEVFARLLKREHFPVQTQDTVRKLWDDQLKIRLLLQYRDQAEQSSAKTGASMFLVAQRMIFEEEDVHIPIDDLERLWYQEKPNIALIKDPEESQAPLRVERVPSFEYNDNPLVESTPDRMPPISTPFW